MKRSFVKWVGGKGRIMPELLKVFPEADCFVEPFVGGGSVFMNTDYAQYRLSDTNPDLILLLQMAAEADDDLIEAAAELWAVGNNRGYYMDMKEKFNDREKVTIEDSIDRAALFLYLNRHGYNGLCRYNSSGGYNVPFGQHPTPPYFPKDEILAFGKKCRESEVIIQCMGFEEAIKLAPKKSVIYADPPYVPSSKSASFAKYHKVEFNQKHHRILAAMLKEAHEKGSKVVLSNSDTLLTKDIYYGFKWHTVSVGRYLGANPKTRGKVNELIGVLG